MDHQGVRVLRDCQGNSSIDSCKETCPLTQQIPYVSLCASVSRCQFYLITFELDCFQGFLDLEILMLCVLISYLVLETISSVWWEWTIQVPHSWVVVFFTLTIEIHPQSPWLELLGSSYAVFWYVRFLYDYVVVCFRHDIPITIVPMISSVTWDVMRGGQLGPTMV